MRTLTAQRGIARLKQHDELRVLRWIERETGQCLRDLLGLGSQAARARGTEGIALEPLQRGSQLDRAAQIDERVVGLAVQLVDERRDRIGQRIVVEVLDPGAGRGVIPVQAIDGAHDGVDLHALPARLVLRLGRQALRALPDLPLHLLHATHFDAGRLGVPIE